MAKIEKMMICGIRSYSPSEPSVIEFQTPLTLIVGPNGTGKTSIIESLKYITTGDLPPGCKAHAFVHDPKIAGEREVKANVKLKFKDVTGVDYHCSRTVVVTQKENKVDSKSLEGVMTKVVNGQKVSISSRCTDFTKEMIHRLGVSKAILNDVIFCHQEDSFWPMASGKELKKKFDEIFASTRYIKAIESMKLLKKEQTHSLELYKKDLGSLEEKKKKSEEITNEMNNVTAKVQATKDTIRKLEEEIRPLQVKYSELNAVSEEVQNLETKISNHKSITKELMRNKREVNEKIENIFEGSTEELETALQDFKDRVKSKERNLAQLESQLKNCNRESQKLSTEKSELLQLRGRIEVEAQHHQQNVIDRDLLISDLATQRSMTGYTKSSSFTIKKAEEFMNASKLEYESVGKGGKDEKDRQSSVINQLEKKIDGIKRNYNEQESSIRHKSNQLKANEEKLKQIEGELQKLRTSMGRVQTLAGQIKQTEDDIEEARSCYDAVKLNSEIDTMGNEKVTLDNELMKLREEQSQMHLHSTTQTKIEMLKTEKQTKEESIQSIIDRTNSNIVAMFGTRPSLDSIASRVNEYLISKRREGKKAATDVQKKNEEIASVEGKRKLYSEQLNQKEQKFREYKMQLNEVCGENNLNIVLEEMRGKAEETNMAIVELGAFDKIYGKYFREVKDQYRKPESGCPLCQRKFVQAIEEDKLLKWLQGKMASIPKSIKNNTKKFEEEKEQVSQLESLAPVKSKFDQLKNEDIPKLRAQYEQMTSNVDALKDEVQELAELRCAFDAEERMASETYDEVRLLDTCNSDLKDIDRTIHREMAKLQGVASGRTMKSITDTIREKQDRVDTLTKKIEQKRSLLMKSERQLSILERSLNELCAEKLKLDSQLQQRTRYETQKADLSSDNEIVRREIRECQQQLGPIKELLQKEMEEKRKLTAVLDEHIETVRKILDRIKSMTNKIRDKNTEISRYVNDKKDEEKAMNDSKINSIEISEIDLNNRRSSINLSIQEASDDVAKQQIQERELFDNLSLRGIEKRLQNTMKEIVSCEQELAGYGAVEGFTEKRNKLSQKLDELKTECADLTGELRVDKQRIRSYQDELRSKMYADADIRHRHKLIEVKTTELANVDIEKYCKALDRAVMRFHSIKMDEINQIIKEYWIKTYTGTDIDTIEIRSCEDNEKTNTKRAYNYRLVMIKGGIPMDMSNRCSAGQKVLASIIIRLALAETFCLHCGILALDEPTTNLDEQNIESLANSLKGVITARQKQRNFQLIIITHDEEFVRALGRSDYVDVYFRIYKDEHGHSKIHRQSTAEMEDGH